MWEKYFGLLNQYETSHSIIPLLNGNLMLGGVRRDFNITRERSYTWLLEVDTSGTLVRQWLDPNDSTYGAYGLIQTKDGGFIYAAQKKVYEFPPFIYSTANVVKMNSAFNKEWTYRGGGATEYTGIYDLEELDDGSFIGCGHAPYLQPDSTIQSGWVIKLSATGDLLWERGYEGFNTPSAYNFLYDIDALPDGGFITCGEARGDSGQFGWILRLDSNGCEVENCLVGVEEVVKPEINGIKVYPNPASTEITVDYSLFDWIQQEEISLVLMNSLGQSIYQASVPQYSWLQRIDISSYPVGLYVCYIKRNVTIIATSKFAKQ